MTRRSEALVLVDVAVGEKIRARREILGMSQSALARTLGISLPMIRKYEQGKTTVSSTRMLAIAAALDAPAAWFFESVPPFAPQGDDRDLIKPIAFPEAEALNLAFCKIANRRVRKRFVSLVRAIAQMGE